MKKKRLMIVGIMAALVIVIGAMAINQSPRWSEKSFEAIVQETVMQPDGEIRLIVERTTEIYGNPVNSLGISEDTKLLGKNRAVLLCPERLNRHSPDLFLKFGEIFLVLCSGAYLFL